MALCLIGCMDYNQEVPGEIVWPPVPPAEPLDGIPGEDVIISPEQPPVDVLFVIDDSHSMLDDQDTLLGHYERFVSPLEASGVWYHWGVTTTDIYPSDDLPTAGVIHWYDSEEEGEPYEASADLISVGTNGNGDERGLSTLLQAIRKARTANAGFFRREADLQVVIVSDEPDWSYRHEPFSLKRYKRELADLKDVHSFVIHAIVNDGSELPARFASDCDAGYAPMYADVATSSGGTVTHICNLSTWGTAIDTIADGFIDPKTEFALEELPVPGTIEVTVQYPENRSPTGVVTIVTEPNAWDYVETRNAVVFNPETFPVEFLHTVVLSYDVAY